MTHLNRLLKSVSEAASARQKLATNLQEQIGAARLAEGRVTGKWRVKKRSLSVVNEHLEPIFNAAMATQVAFQQPVKLISLFILCAYAGTAFATDTPDDPKGFYLGAFAGVGEMKSTSLRQIGTVRLPGPLPDLPIDADGGTDSPSVSLGGVQLGYEWAGWRQSTRSGWELKLAIELEGLYLGDHSPEGEMPIQPQFLGTQYVSFDAQGYALLAGVVLTVETPWSQRFLPYGGVSAGRARVSLSDADSANPSEPGINHFNSDPDAEDTASALQFRLGAEGKLSRHVTLFAEYRYLNIEATRYTFGPTVYPGQHPPTDSWDVQMGELKYDLFVAGLQYRF